MDSGNLPGHEGGGVEGETGLGRAWLCLVSVLENLRDPKPTPNPPVCEAEQGCALAAPRCWDGLFGCWMSFLNGATVPLTPR